MNTIQHLSKTLSFFVAAFLLCTAHVNLQAQACPTNVTGFCNAGFLAVNADFDSATGIGDCPATIMISDGSNTAMLPRFAAACNTSAGAQEAYQENPRVSSFDCTATTFTIDIGTEVCNYVAAGGFNTGAVLPVELSKFTAYVNDETVLLEWETVMEMGNDYFTIEKSKDGRSFTSIGKMNGAELSMKPLQYMFIDNEPVEGRNYYRLKQTDYDGKSEYFEVVTVEYNKGGEISIYPNPVNDRMKVNLTQNLIGQTADITVFSMSSGKQVSTVRFDVTDFELSIDVEDLPSGMYTVLVNIGNQVFNKKIVKN